VNYLPLYASLGELQIEFTLFSASQFNKFKGDPFRHFQRITAE